MMAFDNLKEGKYEMYFNYLPPYTSHPPLKIAIITFADKTAISIDVEGLTV